jgi:glycosyltransferase involved in cell wall biosynthesis
LNNFMERTLSQIVPALNPQVDGVGDYALNLAIHLRDSHGVQTRFIVCDPEWNGPGHIEGFVVRRLRVRNEAGLWSLLAMAKDPQAAVLLHYSHRGYDRLGVPFWLYRGVKSWLTEHTAKSSPSTRFFSTVFHDLWPSSLKPFKREFYTQLLQRLLVTRLHRFSKISIANTLRMQQLLDSIEARKTLWLPIPSNVPTIDRAESGGARPGGFRVAIFGSPRVRLATVNAHANLLRTMNSKNQLASVMLIGKGLNKSQSGVREVQVLQTCVSPSGIDVLGEMTPKDVSLSLGRADLFLSPYPGESACKSGALMAAFAAGCPAVLRDGKNAAPLNESEHFIASDDTPRGVQRLERTAADGHLHRIANAGRLWYERYADWKVVAPQYRQALFDGVHRGRPSGEIRELPQPLRPAWTSMADAN